jgi:hypothetical protein
MVRRMFGFAHDSRPAGRRSFLGSCLKIFIVLFVALAGYAAEAALKPEDKRARIIPVDLLNERAFRVGVDHAVSVEYLNAGPRAQNHVVPNDAQDLNIVLRPVLIWKISGVEYARKLLRKHVGECSDIGPGALTVAPGFHRISVAVPGRMMEPIVKRKAFLGVVGCFVYRTNGEIKRSSVCLFLDHRLPGWPGRFCPQFNHFVE